MTMLYRTIVTIVLLATLPQPWHAKADAGPFSDVADSYQRDWTAMLSAYGRFPDYPDIGLPSALTAAAALSAVDCPLHRRECDADWKTYGSIYHAISPLEFVHFDDGFLDRAATFADALGSGQNFQKEAGVFDLIRAGLQKEALIRYGCAPLPEWRADGWQALEDIHRQAARGNSPEPRLVRSIIQATHIHLNESDVLSALQQPGTAAFLNRLFEPLSCPYAQDDFDGIGLALKTFPTSPDDQTYEAVLDRIKSLLKQHKAVIVSQYCASADEPIASCKRPVSFLVTGENRACNAAGDCIETLFLWLPFRNDDASYPVYSTQMGWRVDAHTLLDRSHYALNSFGWIEY